MELGKMWMLLQEENYSQLTPLEGTAHKLGDFPPPFSLLHADTLPFVTL
jgi:hypothetical protein